MPRNLFLPALLFILFGDFGDFLIRGNQRSPVLVKFPSEFADNSIESTIQPSSICIQ
jgi:hypothetical protein